MILVWNVLGATRKAFGLALKEVRHRFKPKIVVLVETRCSSDNAQKIIRRMGFKFQLLEEARGMSGGIWILWDDPDISISLVCSHHQFVHCHIQGVGRKPWFFTAVYGSPREAEWRSLWEELSNIAVSMVEPWMLAGDFNDISALEKQRGGAMVSERKCKKFLDQITACKLLDLGAEGPKFTWKGPVTHFANRIYKRLDRSLCNLEWRRVFDTAFVRVGPQLQSDHHPLLISITGHKQHQANRPFRFEAAWIKHGEFKRFIKDNWDNQQSIHKELQSLEPKLLSWNVNTFGHIKQKKNELIRRINGIQKACQGAENAYLQDLELKLRAELAEILDQEEILWFQKSRTKWLNDGDRNTAYYHAKTAVRRRKNRVSTLKNEEGEWVEGIAEVGGLVNRYFQELLRKSKLLGSGLTPAIIGHLLSRGIGVQLTED